MNRARCTSCRLVVVCAEPGEYLGGQLLEQADLVAAEAVEEQAPDRVNVTGRGGFDRVIDSRNTQRDEYLRSNDFLAMEDYPEITFVSTAIRQTDEASFEVTGDLTIKGVTNSVTIPFEYEGTATDPFGNLRVGFEGSATISRKDYGVTWNAALETGGVLVSDKIVLEFEISAVKNTDQ